MFPDQFLDDMKKRDTQVHVDNPELAVHAIHSQIILSISIHRFFFLRYFLYPPCLGGSFLGRLLIELSEGRCLNPCAKAREGA